MKLFVSAIFAVLAVSAFAEDQSQWVEIDWDHVLPVQDMPGFWEGREIRPAFYPGDMIRAGRTVGADIVVPHSHPWQAGLLMTFGGGTGLCAGSLINTNRVLTAAHCLIGSSATLVILGAHVLHSVEATQQRRTVDPAQYRVHAEYNPSNLNNDIAILILLTPATLTAEIQTSDLAPADSGTFAGIVATVAAWGSGQLRSSTSIIITNDVCAATFGGIIVSSTICTTLEHSGTQCIGTPGGPLTIPQGGGRLQVGVLSFNSACHISRSVGFTRVSSFAAWIAAQN